MAKKDMKEEIAVPSGVTAVHSGKEIKISGKKGTVSKRFISPNVKVTVEGDRIVLEAKAATKKEKAVFNAYKAHLKNAFKGVTEGHVYKLLVCSGHFPINVSFSKGEIIIKNFFGERTPRVVKIDPLVSVKVDAKDIVLESADREIVGQAAAKIETATRRPGFDRRVFQDGIYITEKCGKAI
jgi:large subunit ribosomal protein L6